MVTSNRIPTRIDLFAGCGGLTRGLQWAGFECLAFNELNSDAADSFHTNFPEAIRLDGDIRHALTKDVIENTLLPRIKERGGLDLLCGGPPCQGFSGIGHRRTHKLEKRDIPTNHLFGEMIRAINELQPSVFLFENVEGILTGRWTSEGETGEIFQDVLESFSKIRGYVCQPTLLHAYGFGVPQNRPRVMIMGVKRRLLSNTRFTPVKFDPKSISQSYSSQLRNNGGLFPTWDEDSIDCPDLIDVLSDIDVYDWDPVSRNYTKEATSKFQRFLRGQNPMTGVQQGAYVLRKLYDLKHTSGDYSGVQMAARSVTAKFTEGSQELNDHQFSNHSEKVMKRFQYMLDNKVTRKDQLPPEMQTRKFNQKPLPARWPTKPTMTVTSLPDDYVHYSEPRTFSVREWARLQTFPDNHKFCGKRTTGGERRAGNPSEGNWDREVPQYTQIGNAVPPLMAEAIGKRILEIIE